MSTISLELRRAQKLLETFCFRRNSGAREGAKRMCCRRHGEELVLVETGSPAEDAEQTLVRLSYRGEYWLLFCSDRFGDWAPYPHLPKASSIQRVIDELEQAPLHVHWG